MVLVSFAQVYYFQGVVEDRLPGYFDFNLPPMRRSADNVWK